MKRWRTTLPADALASLVVFLVALPLCMGVAIASGLPPAAGILTGVIGGLLVGPIQSPALQVSGPTATLAVTMLALVQRHGVAAVAPVVMLAGVIQIAVGLVRGGRWFRIIPPSVVYGMLAGIGVLIAASQFHLVVDDSSKQSGLANLYTIPSALWKGVVPLDGSSHHLAAAIGLLTIFVLVVWSFFVPKKWRGVPAPLMAVLIATGVSALFALPIRHVEVPADLWSVVSLPTWAGFAKLKEPSVLLAAVAVALIGSAETLLSAAAVDRLTPGSRADFDRGLTTQGIGNLACGVLGLPPMTGVIVRSSANVEAGARTRASVVLHAVWLLAFAWGLPSLLSLIPVSCLAAILVFVGLRLVNLQTVRGLRAYGKLEVGIYLATVVAIVLTDLLTGVAIGLGLSVGKLLWGLTRLKIELEDDPERHYSVLHLSGSATFLRLVELARVLEELPPDRELHVRCDELEYLDHACLELLRNWEKDHAARGGRVILEWGDLASRYDGGRNPPPTFAKANGTDDPERAHP
jgi:MFS superfamily sulfate permease-like transporter